MKFNLSFSFSLVAMLFIWHPSAWAQAPTAHSTEARASQVSIQNTKSHPGKQAEKQPAKQPAKQPNRAAASENSASDDANNEELLRLMQSNIDRVQKPLNSEVAGEEQGPPVDKNSESSIGRYSNTNPPSSADTKKKKTIPAKAGGRR